MLIRSFDALVSARRATISSVHIVAYSPKASAAAWSTGSSGSSWPSPAIMASLHLYRSFRCSGSSPMSSAMTMSGTWIAKSSTKSSSPRSATSSMIWFESSRMWSVRDRTRAGVKPRLMSRRCRVCSGSSIEMIDIGAATRGRTPSAAEYSSGWRETCDHIRVARDHPEVVVRVPVDGGVGPQPPVGLPGVVVEPRVEDVDRAGRRRGGHCRSIDQTLVGDQVLRSCD